MTQRKLLEIFFWMAAIVFALSKVAKADDSEKLYTTIEETPPRFEIVVNIPATTLTLYDKGKMVRQHKVAVGSPEWPTPSGKFEIERIEWNPWWYPPPSPWAKGAKPTPPGAGNPLGPVKLMMGDALRIHGTNKPGSVGYAQSHGCMRMISAEAKNLARYLQTEIFGDNDPLLYEKYAKASTQTFVKNLPENEKVWVYLVYEPLEKKSNQVVINPNVYNRKISYEDSLMDLLASAGIWTAPLDMKKFNDIRQKAKGKVSVPLSDLLAEGSDAKTLDPEFTSACLNEAPTQILNEARSRYNTRLQAVEAVAAPAHEIPQVSAR